MLLLNRRNIDKEKKEKRVFLKFWNIIYCLDMIWKFIVQFNTYVIWRIFTHCYYMRRTGILRTTYVRKSNFRTEFFT